MRRLILAWLAENNLSWLGYLVPDYQVMLVTAFIVAALVQSRTAIRLGLEGRRVIMAVLFGYCGALAGAWALGVVSKFVTWTVDGGNLSHIFRTGLHAYGGFLGGIAAGYYYLLRKEPERKAHYLDIIAPGLGLGTAITRVGCFLAGCDYGRIHYGWLGVRFPAQSPSGRQQIGLGLISPESTLALPVIPTQLFEAGVGLAIFFFFQFLVLPRAGARKWPAGAVFAGVALTYAVWRFLIEFVRDDLERGIHWLFSTSQWVSILVVGLVLLWLRRSFAQTSVRRWQQEQKRTA